MNQIENNLKQIITNAVKSAFDIEIEEIGIEIPKEKTHGDYSSNVAMRLTKQLKKNPREVATQLMESIKEDEFISKVEIAGPGFLNFFLNSASMSDVILKVLNEKENFGKTTVGQGIKYNIEYVSANPTGDLHPGHARSAANGDCIARLMKFSGYDVCREYYVNDAGNQMINLGKSLRARYLQQFNIDAQIPQDGYHGNDLIEIAKQLVSEVQDKYVEVNEEECIDFFREYGAEKELNKIKNDLKSFNVEFDVWTSELSIYERGLVGKALEALKAQGNTYESEGALWLRTTDFGDDKDRVLQKSDGSYTYLTPDIAYHLDKLDRGFDCLVDLLGADHHGYVARLKAAIQALGYSADKLSVDINQMARMIKDGKEFKLSKRSGKAVSLRDLIDEAGADAVRYFFASRAADTQMDFDLDMARKQSNENPVYYAQYAHARMASILRQAEGIELASATNLIEHPKELDLCKHINEFSGVVSEAAALRQPHRMCNYIRTLAQLFHSFYGECKVVDKTNVELTTQRLALVCATKITMQNALGLIGVSAPEKM